MKWFINSAGFFFRTLKGCIAEAWHNTDCHYHLPRSRFKDPASGEEERGSDPPRRKIPQRNAFLGSFRDCVAKTWREADRQYYIPKSRFQDPEYKQTAYSASQIQVEHNGKAHSASQVQGVFGRIKIFLVTLKSCISTAWKESDHYHHLPKSRYQDPEFVREKIQKAPKPQGKLVLRPLIIGLGVVDENIEDGWTVGPSVGQPDEEFIVPDDAAGIDRKPEIGPD
jgi:hypothetical protein